MRQELNTHRIRAFSDMGVSVDASGGNPNSPKLAYEKRRANYIICIAWILPSRFVSFPSL